ncbi:DUF732 domain-containing protein [Microbacterium saperdae]
MRKRLVALALVGAAALLAGCAPAMSDEEFVMETSGLVGAEGVSDETLLQFGQSYCAYLEKNADDAEGRTAATSDFLETAIGQSIDVADPALVLDLAIQRFCPQFAGE